jgi:uncharacterized protein (DUF2345 family)
VTTVVDEAIAAISSAPGGDTAQTRVSGPGITRPHGVAPWGAATGTLVAFSDNGAVPLVVISGRTGCAAVAAASTVDLRGVHVGRQVVMVFEGGELSKPIILGLLNEPYVNPLKQPPGSVEVGVDGERLVVSAKEQLVLQCGNASITLTKAGKVLIKGAFVSTQSSGLMRIRGGSIQMN